MDSSPLTRMFPLGLSEALPDLLDKIVTGVEVILVSSSVYK